MSHNQHSTSKPSPQLPQPQQQHPHQQYVPQHATVLGPFHGSTPQLQAPATLMVTGHHHHHHHQFHHQPQQQFFVPQPPTQHQHPPNPQFHAQHQQPQMAFTLVSPHPFVTGSVELNTPTTQQQAAAGAAAYGYAPAPPTYTSSAGQPTPAHNQPAPPPPPPHGIASLPTYQEGQQAALPQVGPLFPSPQPFHHHHHHQHQQHHFFSSPQHHHAPPLPVHGQPAAPNQQRRPSARAAAQPAAVPPSSFGASSFASSNGGSNEGRAGLDRMLQLKQQASDGRLTSEIVVRSMRDGSTRREVQLKGQAHIILHVAECPSLLPPYCAEASGPGLAPADFFSGPLAGHAPAGTLLGVEVTQMRETPTEAVPHPDRRLLGCFLVSEVSRGVVGVEVREAAQPTPSGARGGRGAYGGGPPAQFLDRKPDRIWLILRGILSHTPEHFWARYTALRLTSNLCVHRELATAARGLGLDAAVPSTGRVAADVPMHVVLALRRSFECQTTGGPAIDMSRGCTAATEIITAEPQLVPAM